ncbi:hypothetical protein [Leptospira kmetyi]|uniref:hypothetical protein n=1 Tax=Leptospira kmetyi TaxID=408139 RepID=UPI0002886B4A|nr:hypothetical protein [Leptospira kmetyi]EQA55391.1 hypothetical protein LEP1GSC052_0046 [Leptospira kmetyi serovar Malaysia str. Bejo-Iso9]
MEYSEFILKLIDETKKKYSNSNKDSFKLDFENEHTLIGVRGISISKNKVIFNEDSFDRFNDLLFNIYPGAKSWGSRIVTMDPGKVSDETLLKYGVGGGEARVEEGLGLVKIGSHKNHLALVQASKRYFRRDQNNNHVWNGSDPLYFDNRGFNIHAQGMSKNYVGVSSLGCTVTHSTWEESEWLELISIFQGAEKQARKRNPQFQGFCYAIFNQDSAKKILEG